MERYYRFAGVDLAVCTEEDAGALDGSRLEEFAVDSVTDPHVFRFELTDELPRPGGECIADKPGFRIYREGGRRMRYLGSVEQSLEGAYICAIHEGKEHRVQVLSDKVGGRISYRTVLNSLEAEHLIARNGGFVFHCSYIEWNGRAILFTAPSGTGKSTQAELWKDLRGAEIINGDRAAVRIADGRVMAEGIPFSGSSAYCRSRSLPLAAVVYLGQAPVTSIRRMRGYESFARIWEGCSVNTWDREDVELVSAAVKRLAESVPVYHLPCTPDESAVMALENALKKQVNL